MLVLGIESTCDETAASVVRNGRDIFSNVIASQTDLHAVYGGVVPELACRRHIDLLIPVIDEAIHTAKISLRDIDLISVAMGPGLMGALFIGVEAAKALSLSLQIPFIGVNHIESHLYAAIMSAEEEIVFPALGAVLSGGHTALVLVHGIGSYTLLSQTVDDAIGEAFDKVAKILGLPYPGGPLIEELARKGNPKSFAFHAGQVKEKPLHFSFSGLKTAVLYATKRLSPPLPVEDIAASFQTAAIHDVIEKILQAAYKYRTKTILFGGGVTRNLYLRETLAERTGDHFKVFWPSATLCLDNAAMVAGLGYQLYRLRGQGDPYTLGPSSRLAFG